MVNKDPIEMNKKLEDGKTYNPIAKVFSDSSDEQTEENEEEFLAAEDEINQQEEIKSVETEKDVPSKDLWAPYNFEHQNINNNDEAENNEEEDAENSFETTVQNLKLQESTEYEFTVNYSHLQELILPNSGTNNQEESVETDPDFIFQNDKSKWKNSIMVGKEYQVQIPEISSYDEAAPSENEDLLLWDPKEMTDEEIKQFLQKANSTKSNNIIVQTNKQIKDDARSLYVLLESDYDVDEALRKKEHVPNYMCEAITPFSDIECLGFEQGMTRYGKNFWKIQQNCVKTRTVKELVHFYYLWKKTERHDNFIAKTRSQKKRYLINPGSTDYMDRFFRDTINLTQNKNNYVKSIPGIINSEQTIKNSNEEDDKCDAKITRSKSKSNRF